MLEVSLLLARRHTFSWPPTAVPGIQAFLPISSAFCIFAVEGPFACVEPPPLNAHSPLAAAGLILRQRERPFLKRGSAIRILKCCTCLWQYSMEFCHFVKCSAFKSWHQRHGRHKDQASGQPLTAAGFADAAGVAAVGPLEVAGRSAFCC